MGLRFDRGYPWGMEAISLRVPELNSPTTEERRAERDRKGAGLLFPASPMARALPRVGGVTIVSRVNTIMQSRGLLSTVAVLTAALVVFNASNWMRQEERPSVSVLPKGSEIVMMSGRPRPGAGGQDSIALLSGSGLRDAVGAAGMPGLSLKASDPKRLMVEGKTVAGIDELLVKGKQAAADADTADATASASKAAEEANGAAPAAADAPGAASAANGFSSGGRGGGFGALSRDGGAAGGAAGSLDGAAGPNAAAAARRGATDAASLLAVSRSRVAASVRGGGSGSARAMHQFFSTENLSRAATASGTEGASSLAQRAFATDTIASGGSAITGAGASIGGAGPGAGIMGAPQAGTSVGGGGIGAGAASPGAQPSGTGGSPGGEGGPSFGGGAAPSDDAPAQAPQGEKNVTPYQPMIIAATILLIAGAVLLLLSKVGSLTPGTKQILAYAAAACGGAAAVLGVAVMAQYGQYLQSLLLVGAGGALIWAALVG